MARKLTTEEFIQKARAVHSERYDYSKINYTFAIIKIAIICPIHGEFQQTPNKHLCGRGCPKCGLVKCSESITKSHEQFIHDAKLIHGEKYDYSKSVYEGTFKKLIIKCPCHGKFFQSPHDHLSGRGCKLCGCIKRNASRTKSKDGFIIDASVIHANKYDYSKINYVNDGAKIEISCKKHGSFWQTPNHHLQGNNCPKCKNTISKGEIEFLDYLNIKNRQKYILSYRVDGIDFATNTIYEFLGDYWHGNPLTHNRNDMNQHTKCTFGELYDFTFDCKFKELKNIGCQIKYVWGSEWKTWYKNKSGKIPMKEY